MIAATPLDIALLESETAYNEAARSMMVEQRQAGCSFPEQKRERSVAGGGLPFWGWPIGVRRVGRATVPIRKSHDNLVLSHVDVT